MDMKNDGFYFVLSGKDDEIEEYQKMAGDCVEIFKNEKSWYLSSRDIRAEMDYDKSKRIAEDRLNLLHGIVAFYIGHSYDIKISDAVSKTNKNINKVFVEFDVNCTVVKDIKEEDINSAKTLLKIAIQKEKNNEYKLTDLLKILRNGYPLDYYDSYKIIELVGTEICEKAIGNKFKGLKANLNSEYHQGEKARHSKAKNIEKEKEIRKLSRDEIDKNIRSIINLYIKEFL